MKQDEDWLAVDRAAEYAFEAFMDGASDEEIERYRGQSTGRSGAVVDGARFTPKGLSTRWLVAIEYVNLSPAGVGYGHGRD